MRFVLLFAVTSALLGCVVSAFIFVVDPYGIWKTNIFRPTQYRGIDTRTYHPLRLLSEDFEYVLLGSSRVREGYLPQREGLGISSYNAAFSGASIHEITMFANFIADQETQPKHVVIGIDFFGFAPDFRLHPNMEASPISGAPLWWVKMSTLFGRKHLKAAINSFEENYRNTVEPLPVEFHSYTAGNHKERVKAGLNKYADQASEYNPDEPMPDMEAISALEKALLRLVNGGSKVTLIINPIHGLKLRMIRALNVHTHYEMLMQKLVERSSNVYKKKPGHIELWDFSECRGVVLEPVPDEKSEKMTYFYDANHFSPVFGTDIARQTFLRGVSINHTPAYKGERLVPSVNSTIFTRNWSACKTSMDAYVTDSVNETKEQRCSDNPAWCSGDS